MYLTISIYLIIWT